MSIIAPAVNGANPPLRILCIHGFCQSASTFKGRTAALRSKLKKLAAFGQHHSPPLPPPPAVPQLAVRLTQLLPSLFAATDYAEAPHQLQPGESVFADESSTPGPKYTWWRTNPPVPTGHYTGLLDSINTIRLLCTAAPQPYSGLLGFSQGASFTSLLLQLRQLWQAAQREGRPMIDMGPESWRDSPVMRDVCSLHYGFLSSIRFALLFSAFIPRDPTLRTTLYLPHHHPIAGPLHTLHVMGEQDRVIAIESSRELVGCFESGGESVVEVVEHSGGHHVPSDKAMRLRYVEFIQRQVTMAAGLGDADGRGAVSDDVSERAEKKSETEKIAANGENGG